VRRQPQRTCVACRSTGDKRGLIRIVRTPDGVEVDTSGKKAGRGAYLCSQLSCWQEALKRNRLEPALKTKLTADDRLRVNEYAATLSAVTV
jgi:hypothetical protein